MAVEPIRPSDVSSQKRSTIPDAVIQSFNELIAQNYYDGESTFKQDEVVELICNKMKDVDPDFSDSVIYKSHWLDVETIYRKNGWIVEYDKPGFNESYDPTFSFKRKKPRTNG